MHNRFYIFNFIYLRCDELLIDDSIEMENDHLMTSIQQGDETAFKTFFNLHYKACLAYMTTLTQDAAAAEDITQQSFIVLWEKRATLHDAKAAKQYLYLTARNLFIDRYRHLKSRQNVYAQLKHEALRNRIEEDRDLLELRIEKLKAAVNQLPPRCQEILYLNKQEGLKYAEIATHLNISVKTVEAQMRIAFNKIREEFDKDDRLLMLFLSW